MSKEMDRAEYDETVQQIILVVQRGWLVTDRRALAERLAQHDFDSRSRPYQWLPPWQELPESEREPIIRDWEHRLIAVGFTDLEESDE